MEHGFRMISARIHCTLPYGHEDCNAPNLWLLLGFGVERFGGFGFEVVLPDEASPSTSTYLLNTPRNLSSSFHETTTARKVGTDIHTGGRLVLVAPWVRLPPAQHHPLQKRDVMYILVPRLKQTVFPKGCPAHSPHRQCGSGVNWLGHSFSYPARCSCAEHRRVYIASRV